jgi:hypothetical protein
MNRRPQIGSLRLSVKSGNRVVRGGVKREQSKKAADPENLVHAGSHTGQRETSSALPEVFAGKQNDAKTCAADVLQRGQIDNHSVCPIVECRQQLLLEVSSIGAVEPSNQAEHQSATDHFVNDSHRRAMSLSKMFPIVRAKPCSGDGI